MPFTGIVPQTNVVNDFLIEIPRLEPGQHIDAPIWALRWTHKRGPAWQARIGTSLGFFLLEERLRAVGLDGRQL